MTTLKKFWIEMSNHNRYKSLAIVFSIIFMIFMHGCQSKCESILTPGKMITFSELQAEVNHIAETAQLRADEIAKQDAIKKFIIDSGLTTVSTGGLDWLPVLTGLSALLTGGAIADNVRYRIKFPEKKSV